MDIIVGINLAGFRFINNLAGHFVWLDKFMIFAADKMGYVLIVAILVLFWKKNYFRKLVFVSFGSAIISRFVFVDLIRHFFYSPRPFLILEDINRLMNHAFESSFPSGLTTFYFAMATGVYFYNKKAGRIFLILAGLVGFARIFVSVHWPLDILAGAGLGILVAYLMERFVAPRLSILS